jgi:hypothetical protein
MRPPPGEPRRRVVRRLWTPDVSRVLDTGARTDVRSRVSSRGARAGRPRRDRGEGSPRRSDDPNARAGRVRARRARDRPPLEPVRSRFGRVRRMDAVRPMVARRGARCHRRARTRHRSAAAPSAEPDVGRGDREPRRPRGGRLTALGPVPSALLPTLARAVVRRRLRRFRLRRLDRRRSNRRGANFRRHLTRP